MNYNAHDALEDCRALASLTCIDHQHVSHQIVIDESLRMTMLYASVDIGSKRNDICSLLVHHCWRTQFLQNTTRGPLVLYRSPEC